MTQFDLFAAPASTYVPSRIEVERRNRIRVAAAAFAYEYEDDPIMSDADFDALCLKIDTRIATGNPELDRFFKEKFDPYTGVWVRDHPYKDGLRRLIGIMR